MVVEAHSVDFSPPRDRGPKSSMFPSVRWDWIVGGVVYAEVEVVRRFGSDDSREDPF